MDNCTINFYDWSKLQITLCGIKSSWKVLVINYNYELLTELIFRPPS